MSTQALQQIPNRSVFCRDNLDVLEKINSQSIDLIYLDPPFNKKKTFAAPIGSSAEGAEFSDIFRKEDVKDEWLQTIKEDYEDIDTLLRAVNNLEGKQSYNFCYLAYMSIRLIEMHRILKDIGSIYLHCDQTMSHYLKLLLDCIFGTKNFRNEVVWGYRTGGVSKYYWPKKHDIILCFGKDVSKTFHKALKERVYYKKPFFTDNKDEQGRYYADVYQRDVWDDEETKPIINTSKERVGYPTQKPLALLERIIKASSGEGDIVLDPFCGCATTCVAAEKLNRQWIGIDVSHKAYELVRQRLKKEVEEKRDLFDPEKDVYYSTSPPRRTDLGVDYREQKYVYIISHPKYPGEYKVGIAKDWKSRLTSYQTSDPNRGYTMEFYHLTPCFRQIESYIHENFESKHEWVQGDLQELIKEIQSYEVIV